MGAGEAGWGRRDWWGQGRPMGAVSHRPHARARQHQPLGMPPGRIPSHQLLSGSSRPNEWWYGVDAEADTGAGGGGNRFIYIFLYFIVYLSFVSGDEG